VNDCDLIQIVDAALAEAALKSGEWLVCRKGCTQCCIGPFAINALDAARLRRGLGELDVRDPQRAARIRDRARQSLARISPNFPGDLKTGLLAEDEEAAQRFEDFANDEPCPALDPTTGECDLYPFRPMTCRLFGPPLATGSQELAVCELCFQGATDAEIAGCAVHLDIGGLESALVDELGQPGDTIVAFCLAD
jgi:Fe-S-cluster containining protein